MESDSDDCTTTPQLSYTKHRGISTLPFGLDVFFCALFVGKAVSAHA